MMIPSTLLGRAGLEGKRLSNWLDMIMPIGNTAKITHTVTADRSSIIAQFGFLANDTMVAMQSVKKTKLSGEKMIQNIFEKVKKVLLRKKERVSSGNAKLP